MILGGTGTISNLQLDSEFVISSESAKILAEAISLISQKDTPTLLENLKIISEIFRNLLIGVGAVLAGFSGFSILQDWLKKRKTERATDRLKIKYPIAKLNKDFKIVDTAKKPGKWYLLDMKDKTRHWIETMETMIDMGWVGEGKRIKESTIKRYPEKESILTRRLQ